jgi:epoxyqueuosine reductase QueG
MPDRLDYIKQKLEEQKKSPAVILRHSDGEWAVSEIERLRELVEKKDKVISFRVDGQNRMAAQIEQLRDQNDNYKALIEDAIDAAKYLNEDLKEEPWVSLKEAIDNESTNQD